MRSDATDTLESTTGSVFAPLSVFVERDVDEGSVHIPEGDDTYIESVTPDATGGLSVAFVVNGEMTTVAFDAGEIENGGEQMTGDRQNHSVAMGFSRRF